MSLSSLLLSAAGQKSIDTELDALFSAKPTAPAPSKPVATPIAIPGSSKDALKKRKAEPDAVSPQEPSKRSKASSGKADSKRGDQALKIEAKSKKASKAAKASSAENPNRKGKAKEAESASEDENSDLENVSDDAHDEEVESDEEEDPHDVDPSSLVHETMKKDGKKTSRSGSKAKFVPPDETPEQRDQRTIFIGNLSVDVAQKRPLLKQLQRHILSQVPTAKIESTRFRSVPFQAPTSRLPDNDTSVEGGKPNPKAGASTTTTTGAPKSARAHDLERTSAWRSRSALDDADTENLKKDEKRYLTPNQKKKVAFIKQEFHSTADTVHAYIVFAHPVPPEFQNRPKNLPPLPEVMDPYEAARMAVQACDGSVFLDRVIRVDLVEKKHALERAGAGEGGELDLHLADADPKSSVFVGNLDFASKEEDLRVFFEGVVSAERGPPPPPAANDQEGAAEKGGIKKPRTWVIRVRIVRDKDTQLGKGFAYVQFADRQCVDEVLALEPGKLKFAKRKLRVQRCRTLPGSSVSTRQATASTKPKANDKEGSKNGKPMRAPVPIVVPKGDPSLGKRLAHLPKEARKQLKSADADRVARRLAKKKARMAMASKGGMELKGKVRVRERVRKSEAGEGKKKANAGTKKRRVRSEKALAKFNGKKKAGGAANK
ncbi:putative RNA recognition motif containing protein [Lyophyllum shimeji]|uniref:Nucleolar protein 12 n=1 Tax=Lyophyllum shimeji TaxID=47721 RepID=A0A9P3PNX8_LYOSH|nr:putative RNA recognition motif containing protein [Lyophyllum shimeji]